LEDIERMAEDAYRQLPEEFRSLCSDVVIRVTESPTDEVLDAMGAESELDLMGLFQGVGLPFRSDSVTGQMPNMVWLYRVPMLLYWAEHEETIGSIVTHVLVHEIGHHFGMSDEDMERIERAAE
jgi:predicted Zn-dependent protease with MMP-like domain